MVYPTKWTVAATALLGLWLLIAPFVLGAPVVDQWNDIIVGSGIVIAAGYNYSRKRELKMLDRRATAVNGMLGVWLLVAPFVFGVSNLLLWNDVIVGIGVTSLALYNVYAAPRLKRVSSQMHHDEA